MRSRYAAFFAGALLALAAAHAHAEDCPRKSVKIIVPFAADGPADVYVARRLLALLADPASRGARRNARFEPVRRTS